MASETGRGAQVRLDGAARQLARGGAGVRLVDSILNKQALEASGAAATGDTADGSTASGTAADDELLAPGGAVSFGAADSAAAVDVRVGEVIGLRIEAPEVAVNYPVIAAAAAGGGVFFSAQGSDAAVGIVLADKGGAGAVLVSNGAAVLKADGPPLAANWIGMRSTITGGTPAIYSWGDPDVGLAIQAHGTGGLSLGASTNKLGFFAAQPVAKPAGVPVTAAGVHAALVSLGLISG